ncbi:hypothetical protein K2Q00_01380 [Patescibacteria group bacterium]|nr:hypothetical protein [Patescibacteria group bacterium]
MNEKQLWSYFLERQVSLSTPLNRKQVWVKREDFEVVKTYFMKDFNILHPNRSFRSHGYFLHIQCVDQGEYVLVHRDMANHARFFPLIVLHFFLDVLPYMVLAWRKRVSFYSIFTKPQ